MALRTYGRPPVPFQLGGESYFTAWDVGQYLKLPRGSLFKRFPQLFKRVATNEDKEQMEALGFSKAILQSSVLLVKAADVNEIFEGHEEKFKNTHAATSSSGTFKPGIRPNEQRPAGIKPSALWSSQQVVSGSHHLESVPSCTPCAHIRKKMRNLGSRFTVFDDDERYSTALEVAEEAPELVPIRLDMEIDNVKLRDTFCYNKNEKLITPEMIAEAICEDLELPVLTFMPAIVQSITQQLEAHAEVPVGEHATDQRVIIKLNIHVGNQSLVDQFEWDISDPNNNPEEVANKLCSELGLGGEFASAIAYSIRGQIAWNKKTYAFSESPLPVVASSSSIRAPGEADHWGPFLETLTDAEIEKKMRDQDRNTRRMRRLVNSNPYGV